MPLLLLALACTAPDKDAPTPEGLSIIATSPEDGARDVPVDTTVVVTFNGDLDPDALDAETLTLVPETPGVYAWDPATHSATFTPGRALLWGSPYRVRISAALGLDANEEIVFTTAVAPTDQPPDATLDLDGDLVTVAVPDAGADTRTYTLTSTHPFRDGVPEDGTRVVIERADKPRVRTGDLLFDGLFAMAMDDLALASVSEIRDGAFNNGGGTPCDCFETGERWTYVWTRDTAYAVDLALGLLEPERARNSLAFKLSRPKAGGPLQIVQDTGSGGSWPVSTDRVVWALGARRVIDALEGPERDAFVDDTLEALQTTLDQDRATIYDPLVGLYRGEQSFLDWREQSYPAWTAGDVTALATSHALSTNAGHHALLRLAADLGEQTGHPDAATWRRWSDDLGVAMRAGFNLPDGTLSSLRLGPFVPAPLYTWDQLGTALAIQEGIPRGEQALGMVAAYPHTRVGPPVIWPQRPDTPIYHNRGVWPFVTAYGLLAARDVGHEPVYNHDLDSLVVRAALNLSNMENFEFLSGRPWVDAGAESGPVVNSRRQLWSVAGYLAAVVRGVFGVELGPQGLTVSPFITPDAHARWLGGTDTVTLRDLPYHGRRVDVIVTLPAVGAAGGRAYEVADLRVDGAAHTGVIRAQDLANGSEIRVTLTDPGAASPHALTLVEDDGEFRRFWPPKDPSTPTVAAAPGGLRVTWADRGETGLVWQVWRDGVIIADQLTSPSWTDTALDPDTASPCYAITARWTSTGLVSMPGPATCWWGEGASRLQLFDAWALRPDGQGPTWSEANGEPHYAGWGAPDHTLVVEALRPRWSGRHAVQLRYANGAGGLTTGITAGHKRVTLTERDTGLVAAEGYVVMPHTGAWDAWRESTWFTAELDAGVTYRLVVSDAPNMTWLEHFRGYTGGLGGGGDTFNDVDVAQIKLLPLLGFPDPPPPDAVALDGTADLDAYDAAQRVAPGAPLEAWSAMALDWDEEHLYVTIVSSAFERDFEPFLLYLEADPAGDAAPSDGVDYAYGVITAPARVPFDATHVVALRAEPGQGPQGGPWPGLYARLPAGDAQVVRFKPGRDSFLAADRHTLSARVPLAPLGHPRRLRVAGHLLHGAAGAEFKELLPAGAAPWQPDGGSWFEVDLTGPHDAAGWVLAP